MSNGTFMISRRIWEHEEFAPSSFSEREAFMYLISEASWKPRRKRVGKVVVGLERGQLAHSTRFLADAWGWHHSKVRRFLERLENRHMIERSTDTGVSIISLTNYDTYQVSSQSSDTAPTHNPTQNRHSSDTNENKGEIKGRNNNHAQAREDGFDAFWDAYPRKVGKDAARKAFSKAVKKTPASEVMAGLKAQLPSITSRDRQYQPHPATWLNQGRWQDQVEAPQRRAVNIVDFTLNT